MTATSLTTLRLPANHVAYARPKTEVGKTNPHRAGFCDGYQLREPNNLWAADRPMLYKFPLYFRTKAQVYTDAYAEGLSRRRADDLKALSGGLRVSA